MIKTIGENIIFKITVKKSVAGIIMPGKESKLMDKFYIDKTYVYQVGDKIESVKPGQEVILSGRPMLPIDIEDYIGEKKDEGIMYSRGKIEDIVCVIE